MAKYRGEEVDEERSLGYETGSGPDVISDGGGLRSCVKHLISGKAKWQPRSFSVIRFRRWTRECVVFEKNLEMDTKGNLVIAQQDYTQANENHVSAPLHFQLYPLKRAEPTSRAHIFKAFANLQLLHKPSPFSNKKPFVEFLFS